MTYIIPQVILSIPFSPRSISWCVLWHIDWGQHRPAIRGVSVPRREYNDGSIHTYYAAHGDVYIHVEFFCYQGCVAGCVQPNLCGKPTILLRIRRIRRARLGKFCSRFALFWWRNLIMLTSYPIITRRAWMVLLETP